MAVAMAVACETCFQGGESVIVVKVTPSEAVTHNTPLCALAAVGSTDGVHVVRAPVDGHRV